LAGKSAGRSGANLAPVIIIRRDEGEEPPHHGGAWKVAYADFVTAMMAFFLLMWLLNATTEEQRTGLADYFAPTNLFGRSVSGSGQPFGGKTPNEAGTSVSSEGAPQAIRGRQTPTRDAEEDDTETAALPLARAAEPPDDAIAAFASPIDGRSAATKLPPGPDHQVLAKGGDYAAARLTPAKTEETAAAAEATRREAAIAGDAQRELRALEQAGAQLLDAIRRDPALKDVVGQLMIDNVPEGLRIQVVDAERQPMFALGGAAPTKRVRDLMRLVVPALAALPNAVSIAGHTDALTYRGQDKGNWELSSERANATRRILVEAGLDELRIRSVTGNADRDLLVPGDPLSPANRRISIVVLRHAAAPKPDTRKSAVTP
jgi:chemotaxis protein MotB